MVIKKMSYNLNIPEFISELADALTGSYSRQPQELIKMKEELYDLSMSNCAEDKKQLKKDLNIFLKDTKNAYKSIKEELVNG